MEKKMRNPLRRAAIAILATVLAFMPAMGVSASNTVAPEKPYKIETSALQTGGTTWTVQLDVTGKLSALSSTDIVFVIDASNEMSKTLKGDYYEGMTHMEFAKYALKNYADSLLKNDILNSRIGIVSYSKDAHIQSPLSKDEATVYKGIDGITITEGANIQAGLKAGYSLLKDSKAVSRVIVLVSCAEPNYCYSPSNISLVCNKDGNSHTIAPARIDAATGFDYNTIVNAPMYTCSHQQQFNMALIAAEYESQILKQDSTIIYTMGFTANSDTTESLLKISTKSSNEFINISQTPNAADIQMFFNAAISNFAQRAILGGLLYMEIPMATSFDLGTSNISSSQGSTLLKAENRALGWIPGDISSKASLKFNVKLKEGVKLENETEAFSRASYIKYTDENDDVVTDLIPPPVIKPNSGSITLYPMVTDANGAYIDEKGAQITLEKALKIANPIMYTTDGSDILAVPGAYNVSAPKYNGYECKSISVSSTYGSPGTEYKGDKVVVSLTKDDQAASLYLSYQKTGSSSGGTIIDTGSTTSKPAPSGDGSPETGDSTMLGLWAALSIALLAAIVAIIKFKRPLAR